MVIYSDDLVIIWCVHACACHVYMYACFCVTSERAHHLNKYKMGNITLKLLGDSHINCTDLVHCCGCSDIHSVLKYHTIAYILALLVQEFILTHCGPVTQICVFCVFALQLWKTDDANLPFNTRLVFTHLITQYIKCT
jgi:hypothetical protein